VAGHGGKRNGSGRKPNADKYIGPISRAEQRICENLDDLIDLAFVRARGYMAKDVGPDGEVEYYETPPDLKAIIYLVDRVMGKPTERHEHDFGNVSDEDLIALWKAEGHPGRNGTAGNHPA
jgi:hypothetical protein